MGLIDFTTLFDRQPRDGLFFGLLGGLDPVYDGIAYRKLEDFEAATYANNAALQAVWTADGGAALATLGTTQLVGDANMSITADAGTVALSRTFVNSRYGFAFPGQRDYPGTIVGVRFRATTSIAAGETIQVRLRDDSDATMFHSWNVTIGTSANNVWEVDFRRTPDSEGATTWNEALIDEFGFAGLDNGTTYRFDEIQFISPFTLQDYLYEIKTGVDELLTETELFHKSGPNNAELDDALTWAMELYDPGGDIITVGEITPGNYQIDRVRNGALVNIVAATPASEAAGRIFASYTPTSVNWALGDLMLVTFSGGSIVLVSDTGTTTTILPNGYFYTRLSREEDIYTVTGTTGQITVPTDATWDDVNKWWEGNILQHLQKIMMFLAAGDGANVTEITEDHSVPFLLGLGSSAASVQGIDTGLHQILRGLATAMGVTAAAGGQFEVDGSYDLWDVAVTGQDSTAIVPNENGSIEEMLKLIIAAVGGTSGTADAGSTAAQLVDAARTEADGYWASHRIIMYDGGNAGLGTIIETFTAATDTAVFVNAFPNAIVAGNTYIIVPEPHAVVPTDDTGNVTWEQVIGSKADAAVQAVGAAASLVAIVKALKTNQGDPSGHTLTTWTTKWGNSTESFATITGLTSTAADQTTGAATIQARLRGILTSLGNPVAHTLATITAKWGDLDQSFAAWAGSQTGHTFTSIAAKWGNTAQTLAVLLGAQADTRSTAPSAGVSFVSWFKGLMALFIPNQPVNNVSLAAIDTTLTTAPDGTVASDAANTVINRTLTAGSHYRLEDLHLRVTSFGTGTYVDVIVWEFENGTMYARNTVRVGAGGVYALNTSLSLMDIIGRPNLVGEAFAITTVVDTGSTGALRASWYLSTSRIS